MLHDMAYGGALGTTLFGNVSSDPGIYMMSWLRW